MREVKYLSPTSIQKWVDDREEFYRDYLLPIRIDREPQLQVMAIGSAFDAFVKSALHEAINGKGADERFKLENIFEKQVEPQNRDWALLHGKYVFDTYKKLGAFDDLLIQLQHAKAEPKFEDTLEGPIGDAVLQGKPDAWYFTPEGHPVIFDWKVNGYCANYAKSPLKGYIKLRGDSKKGMYPGAMPGMYKGTMINKGFLFEDAGLEGQKWSAQLSIYAWLCGQTPGKDFVVAIDQIACDARGTSAANPFPQLRVAEHRALVGERFQRDLYALVQRIWKQIKDGHIFDTMSLEDSLTRCRQLDESYLSHLPGYGPSEPAPPGRQRF